MQQKNNFLEKNEGTHMFQRFKFQNLRIDEVKAREDNNVLKHRKINQ